MIDRVGKDIGYCARGAVTLFDDEVHAATAVKWLDEVEGLPGVLARIVPGHEVTKLDKALGTVWHSFRSHSYYTDSIKKYTSIDYHAFRR